MSKRVSSSLVAKLVFYLLVSFLLYFYFNILEYKYWFYWFGFLGWYSGYYTAAAVIAGVVLETGMRELCNREKIDLGKLDKMNADLVKLGAYNKLQQKRITALADIRNSAAHGNVKNYTEDDVEIMIRDIEYFLEREL